MKQAESKRLWAERIAAWKASGLKQRQFCEREALPYRSFLWWRRQLRSNAHDTELVAVVVRAPATAVTAKAAKPFRPRPLAESGLVSEGVAIRLHGGRSLALSGALDEGQLCRLIRLLEALPC